MSLHRNSEETRLDLSTPQARVHFQSPLKLLCHGRGLSNLGIGAEHFNVGLKRAMHLKVASRAFSRFPNAPRTTPQLRFARANSSLANPQSPSRNETDSTEPSETSPPSATSDNIKLDSAEPRLAMAFTCTANGCNHRSAHVFTKRSYERGIVIIQCPSCKNRHLVADHLGWFKDDTEQGKLRTIEDILRARGEEVRRGTLDSNGDIEFVDS